MLVLKRCRKCNVERPATEFAAAASRKDGLQPYCKGCNRAYRNANKAKIDRYREQHRESYRAANSAWREANPEAVKSRNAQYYRQNRDASIRRVRDWQRANPDRHCAIQSRRYARVKSAQPVWADPSAIAAVYAQASAMRASGMDVHVDHVVPLRSKRVCGLHVETNLQIIDRAENVRKNNRHWPDMA